MTGRMWVRGAVLMTGLGVVVLTGAAGVSGPQAIAAPITKQISDTQVLDCTGRTPSVKPTELEPGCSSSHQYLTGLDWHVWGSDVAVGEGTYHVNKCDPACAAGNFETLHAWVVLSAPAQPGMFTKVTIADDKGQWTTTMPVK
ncbi:hypothetical protein VMT65_18495 [Nocardia sp. CDC153]|uniref:hypothetical protein n=1 Tax=Nocardia sp. CDC153 TaxID=3112167 RepID=UPI002DB8A28A|nr:hypothetical protein [Nocardia sp. CDC153]MEC3955037.1 hypothetical protein [Nocardia sp. CDC153]